MTFIVYRRLPLVEAVENMQQIEKWFNDNPTRRVCRTDLFKVRKNHIVGDILEHSIWPVAAPSTLEEEEK